MRGQFRGQQFTAASPYDAPTAPIDAQTLRLWWAMEQNNCTEIPIGRSRVTNDRGVGHRHRWAHARGIGRLEGSAFRGREGDAEMGALVRGARVMMPTANDLVPLDEA